MNLPLSYRKATENDIDFLLDLRIKTMTEHYKSSHLPISSELNLEKVLYQFDEARIILLDKQAIGLLKMKICDDKIDIFQLQIHPEFQGKGIGKVVLVKVLEEASAHQKPVFLSVLKTNKAKNLYSHLGFEIIDEDEHSYFMKYSK